MKIILLIICCIALHSCTTKPAEVSYQSSICISTPPFLKQLGYTGVNAAFSTSDKKIKGLIYIQAPTIPNTPNIKYQDSTWKMAGWLGPILTDNKGNIWCAPVPVINVLDNPTELQNNLYKVNATSGKMEMYLTLPTTEKVSVENPYGILGLAYNCEANTLYVSTVAGSTRNQQHGKIVCINTETKTIISTLNCGDAFGLGISYKEGYRKLYFGNARNSNIYSIALADNGTFVGDPILAFSVEGLGPRGDDKAKKIREDKQGNLLVSGFEFNFNLTAPTEKQENNYTFYYNQGTEKWTLK